MATDQDKEGGAATTNKAAKYDRFRLDERPQRKPGRNAYFDDIRSEIARQEQIADSESPEGTESDAETGRATETVVPLVLDAAPSDEDHAGTNTGFAQQRTPVVRPITPSSPARRRLEAEPSGPTVASLPSPVAAGSFEDFRRHWGPFLKRKQMELCQVLFAHTIASGKSSFLTKTDDLCIEMGVSSRHLLYLLKQLEMLGFVTRHDEKTDNNKTLGKRITFRPFPPR